MVRKGAPCVDGIDLREGQHPWLQTQPVRAQGKNNAGRECRSSLATIRICTGSPKNGHMNIRTYTHACTASRVKSNSKYNN